MKIISVVGARPNFIKIAPFCHALAGYHQASGNKIEHILVHTGQHYDDKMSRDFFSSLNIPAADINLNVRSGSHAEQVGYTMIAFEKILKEQKPDMVVVVGDVNAVCACSITAKKENIKLAHIEAGLRSGDMSMPEEVNRLVADRLADLLFTPDRIASDNLRREGVPDDRIKLVGNIMIDTLEARRQEAAGLALDRIVIDNMLVKKELPADFQDNCYGLLTLHRPSNVDHKETLESLLGFIEEIAQSDMAIVWTLHPRTQKRLEEFGLWNKALECGRLIMLGPLKYQEMLRLNMGARIMFTDSGGLQEECCVLGTPCITLRWNTERPITLCEHGGTCILAGNDVNNIRKGFDVLRNKKRSPARPDLWDGHTADRIVEVIVQSLLS
jgi:UDP-N-acetylglucosamine 2-epimerase (non-hydrolysing)